jgi:hypothetical protein
VSIEATIEIPQGISKYMKHLCIVSTSAVFSFELAEERIRAKIPFPTAVVITEAINHHKADVVFTL